MYIFFLLILPFISAFFTSWARLSLDKTAVNMKSVAAEAVYQKALRLSSSGKGAISTGELLNVMSADTQSILRFTLSSCMILLVPISVLLLIHCRIDYHINLFSCRTARQACFYSGCGIRNYDCSSVYVGCSGSKTSSKNDEESRWSNQANE